MCRCSLLTRWNLYSPVNLNNMPTPSELDVRFLALIRENVRAFMAEAALKCVASPDIAKRLLDIAPQDHAGARPFFPAHVRVDTLDINPNSGATYIADLCCCNDSLISSGCYDYVVCTEVLEHTLNPFNAVKELHRVLKDGGLLFVSVPLNFRIHGPLPDCWRFTEHGLKALLRDFSTVEIKALETPERPLMPVHYTVTARK